MRRGKGSDDFEAYAKNFCAALQTFSVRAQLDRTTDPRAMRFMIYNPYMTNLAQTGICRIRTSEPAAPSRD